MKNWEEVYNKYENGEMKQRYNELRAKFTSQKNRTMEDFNELKKMEKIMGNLPKVKNIINYQEKLDEELTILKEEYNARMAQEAKSADIEDVRRKFEYSKEAIAKAEAEIDDIVMQINEAKNRDEIGALKEKRDEALKKLGELNTENAEIKTKLEESEKTKPSLNKSLEKYTTEELREKCFKISSEVSKSNVVAGFLMEGANRDSIALKIEGWKDRNYTSKTKLPLTRKERAEKNPPKKDDLKTKSAEEAEKDKQEPLVLTYKDLLRAENARNQQYNEDIDIDDKGTALIDPNDFATAFPRLAKRFPNMGNNILGKALLKTKNIFRRNKQEIEDTDEQIVATSNKSNSQAKETKPSFKDYLKYDVLDVAEKGVDGIDEERKAELKEKLEANRKAAMEREER